MARPLIGITTYGRDAGDRYSIPTPYVTAVQRAGGLPLLIPPGAQEPEEYLDRVDGIVLAGGGDIDPLRYGDDTHEALYGIDADRDALELALARAVARRRQPTLAICRGMQMINVALGGTLIPHLPAAVGEAVLHRAPPRDPIAHAVSVRAGSRLARLAGATQMAPLSWHHQAIRTLAPGLDAVAHAPDGTIEAVEFADAPWLIAVQWHPELTAHEDQNQQRLFGALLAQISPRQGA